MELSTFCFNLETRWSVERFPALDSAQTLVLVFASAAAAGTDLLAELAAAYPKSTIAGCTTAGEIADDCIQDDSASIAVLKFERSHFMTAFSSVCGNEDCYAAGRRLANQLPRQNLCAVFILMDGLATDCSKLLEGIYSSLPDDVPVSGGLAGDGGDFRHSLVIRDGAFVNGTVAAIGFYGDCLQITHGSHSSLRKLGPERRVTRSEANVLHELDGRPALALYKEYLGNLASGLPAAAHMLPLLLSQDKHGSGAAVRAILAYDDAVQSLTLSGDIPAACLAQLMRADPGMLRGAELAAAEALDGMAVAGQTLALTISDIGRRLAFGQLVEEECETLLQTLPRGTRQTGFYSYGQIVPCSGRPSELQHQSILVTTICEA